MEYKTVPGPAALTTRSKDAYKQAVLEYAEIIQKEAVGGWELVFIQQIPVIQRAGCFGSIFGGGDTQITFNMLVFKKG